MRVDPAGPIQPSRLGVKCLRWHAWLIAALLLIVPALAHAQEVDRFEMSAGYSYLRLDTRALGLTQYTNANGGIFGLGLHFTPWLAAVADLSANYGRNGGNSFRSFYALTGPQVAYRRGRSSFLARGLVGEARSSVSGLQATDTGLAWGAGGGYEYRLTPYWVVRPVQADYIRSNTFSSTQKSLRISAAIVLTFGKNLNAPSP
jgi:hypothetical protein